MTTIPGSDLLNSILHIVSQSLLLPVIIILLVFMVYIVFEAGGLISEYTSRVKVDVKEFDTIIKGFSTARTFEDINEIIISSNLPKSHKEILYEIGFNTSIGIKSREAFARKLIENEEVKAAKRIEKTDIIAKIGPAIGLMGTLIPIGPGLAALGTGDIQVLSSHLMIAFDAAVLGMATAAIGFTISKIRRRWYEEQISTLDSIAESLLEVTEIVKTKTDALIF